MSAPMTTRDWRGEALLCREAPKGMPTEEVIDGVTYPVYYFLASEPVEDSYGDIVLAEWDLKRWNANPVVLWGHESYSMPIGKGKAFLEVDTGRLFIAVTVWDSPKRPEGQAAAEGVRHGFISACSVGFRSRKVTSRSLLPKDDPKMSQRGDLLGDNELYELSLCSIPALASALAQRGGAVEVWAKAAGLDLRTRSVDTHVEHALASLAGLTGLTALATAYLGGEAADEGLANASRNLVRACARQSREINLWLSKWASPDAGGSEDDVEDPEPWPAGKTVTLMIDGAPISEREAGDAVRRLFRDPANRDDVIEVGAAISGVTEDELVDAHRRGVERPAEPGAMRFTFERLAEAVAREAVPDDEAARAFRTWFDAARG